MGLYDDVKCQYKLPGATNEVQKDVFQTKDLGSMMDSYTITEDGKLLQSIREYYEVPEEERPYYGTPEWEENQFKKLVGSMESKFIEDRKINHHGIIYIYTITADREWWEYEIKFTDGKVVSVKRINKEWLKDLKK
jgi:hypothetical protein